MSYIYMHYYEEPENRFIKYTYIKHYASLYIIIYNILFIKYNTYNPI